MLYIPEGAHAIYLSGIFGKIKGNLKRKLSLDRDCCIIKFASFVFIVKLLEQNSWVQSSNCISVRTSGWAELSKSFILYPLYCGLFSSQEARRPDWELVRFCQTVIVQNFVKQLQSMFKVWFLHRNWMKSILSISFLPSRETGLRGYKFLLVLCHWWSLPGSCHRWGLRSGESSFLVCGICNV